MLLTANLRLVGARPIHEVTRQPKPSSAQNLPLEKLPCTVRVHIRIQCRGDDQGGTTCTRPNNPQRLLACAFGMARNLQAGACMLAKVVHVMKEQQLKQERRHQECRF
jgi:hypothetical protein